MFDDTVKNNITYANLKATDEEIKKAAELSFASEFIEKLPNKYDTMIGENGVRLSGGEKQRLSIARAMLKKSSIILLDEATSYVRHEVVHNKYVVKNLKNKTTIVIAHRLSTILGSHKIYVIDSGKVNSAHKELLDNSGLKKISMRNKLVNKNDFCLWSVY